MKKLPLLTAAMMLSSFALPHIAMAVPANQAIASSQYNNAAQDQREGKASSDDVVLDMETVNTSDNPVTTDNKHDGSVSNEEVSTDAAPTSNANPSTNTPMPPVPSIDPSVSVASSVSEQAETTTSEQATAITLQEKKKDKRGELIATQPGQLELKENRRLKVQ